MDNEMIERVAKALWDEHQQQPTTKYGFSNALLFGDEWHKKEVPWEFVTNSDNCIPIFAQEYRNRAKMVIKAMREPTEKMMNAENVHLLCNTCGGHYEGWQAMIDAVINDA